MDGWRRLCAINPSYCHVLSARSAQTILLLFPVRSHSWTWSSVNLTCLPSSLSLVHLTPPHASLRPFRFKEELMLQERMQGIGAVIEACGLPDFILLQVGERRRKDGDGERGRLSQHGVAAERGAVGCVARTNTLIQSHRLAHTRTPFLRPRVQGLALITQSRC